MSTTETSKITLFPADQGTKVRPSRRLPFEREKPVGSTANGILALIRARWIRLLIIAYLVSLLEPRLQAMCATTVNKIEIIITIIIINNNNNNNYNKNNNNIIIITVISIIISTIIIIVIVIVIVVVVVAVIVVVVVVVLVVLSLFLSLPLSLSLS